jgi:hypothetical protein
MILEHGTLYGLASVAMDSAGKRPYLVSTMRGSTRPHPFSSLIGPAPVETRR